MELSRKILNKFLKANLVKVDFKDLKNTFGLGKSKACEIIACFELGRRKLKDKKGVYLGKFVGEMIKIAKAIQKPALGNFNGIALEACSDSSPEEIIKLFEEKWQAS